MAHRIELDSSAAGVESDEPYKPTQAQREKSRGAVSRPRL
jgi:hypothetical protein